MDNDTMNLRAEELKQAAFDFIAVSRVAEKYRSDYEVARQQLNESLFGYVSCGYADIFSEFEKLRTDVGECIDEIIDSIETDGLSDSGMSQSDIKALNDLIGDLIDINPKEPLVTIKDEIIGMTWNERFFRIVHNHAHHLRLQFLTALLVNDQYAAYRGEAWKEVFQYVDSSFNVTRKAILFANVTDAELSRTFEEFNSRRVHLAMRSFQRGEREEIR